MGVVKFLGWIKDGAFVSTPTRLAVLGTLPTRGRAGRYILTRSAFGSYIGFSDASAAKRSPAISIS